MDSNIIERIKTGDKAALGEIYLQLRTSFILHIRNKYRGLHSIDEIAKDIYQDAIEILYNNIKENKPIEPQKVKAYVFAIGENKISELHRRKNKDTHGVDLEKLNRVNEDEQYKETQLVIVETALNNLSERNREILKMFYLKSMNIDEIAQVLESSYDSVKSMKSRALKTLIEAVANLEMSTVE